MDLRYPTFVDRLEWNRLATEERSAQVVAGGRAYTPLPPATFQTSKRLFLIGIGTSTPGSARWVRGGWATAFSVQRPDSFTQFQSRVQIASEPLRLGSFVPLKLPTYGSAESVLELRFPYYFRHVYFEIWWYDGDIVDPVDKLDQILTLLNN